jgi:antitoxin (DNA-binding transcriptional repressor) of toxin-antitoxin stability system
MDISVTIFRAQCLELIRQIEAGGEPITIRRRGKAVAQLTPPPGSTGQAARPWEQMRGTGSLLASPEESVLQAGDFEALR